MITGRIVYRFGPFTLDPGQRRLFKGDERVPLPAHPAAVLVCLVEHAGRVVDKDTLIAAAWAEPGVTDDSLRQAVTFARQALDRQPDGSDYIETRMKRGYEFTAPVERVAPGLSDASLDGMLDPYRAFVNGRAALLSLDLTRINEALVVFERLVVTHPRAWEAHVALASACMLLFESTRTGGTPDVARLQQASEHARIGVRLNPESGEAWATLALVKSRTGDTLDAEAAARKAVDLDPSDWLHHLRHAGVTWGQERIRAATRALDINPDLAPARWLIATVYVARNQLERARDQLLLAIACDEAKPPETGHLKAVGLHWSHGLVLAALGRQADAMKAFAKELAVGNGTHIYGLRACVNAAYASDVIKSGAAAQGPAWGASVEQALRTAAALTLEQRWEEAAGVCRDALNAAPPGPAGWIIPVEPRLNVRAHPEAWEPTLAILRQRAM